jgi:hypothetical protein
MRRTLAFLACLAVFGVAGCGGESAQPDWPGPGQPGADGSLEVASFNEFLADEGELYARSPFAAVTEFLRLDDATAASISLVSQAPGEARSPVTVVATLDRLFDDSVRAQRYVLVLDLGTDESWRVRSAKVTQRCWPGRGHQTFSAELCV